MSLTSSEASLRYGSESHADCEPSYTAIAYGQYNVIVDANGVHINGAKGVTHF